MPVRSQGVGRAPQWRRSRSRSREGFVTLSDDVRAEYVDGTALVSPPPTFAHQEVCQRLRDLLKRQAGDGAVVAVAVGWQLPGDRHRLRIPDVMLLEDSPAGDVVTDAPSVVIEVLSGNRADDLVRKSVEYWQAGVGQYWVVDPGLRVIDVYAHNPTGWDRIVQLTEESPEATVVVPPIGTIPLSLPDVLR